MATTEFGATLTGVTLSTEQLAFGRKRVARTHGWRARPTRACRTTATSATARNDAVVSIEMVRPWARYWPTYFLPHQAPARAVAAVSEHRHPTTGCQARA